MARSGGVGKHVQVKEAFSVVSAGKETHGGPSFKLPTITTRCDEPPTATDAHTSVDQASERSKSEVAEGDTDVMEPNPDPDEGDGHVEGMDGVVSKQTDEVSDHGDLDPMIVGSLDEQEYQMEECRRAHEQHQKSHGSYSPPSLHSSASHMNQDPQDYRDYGSSSPTSSFGKQFLWHEYFTLLDTIPKWRSTLRSEARGAPRQEHAWFIQLPLEQHPPAPPASLPVTTHHITLYHPTNPDLWCRSEPRVSHGHGLVTRRLIRCLSRSREPKLTRCSRRQPSHRTQMAD